MAKALSADLRERIVGGICDGKSRRAVAAQFGVAPSTAVRLQARFEATGSVRRRGRAAHPAAANWRFTGTSSSNRLR
jgi:transposase